MTFVQYKGIWAMTKFFSHIHGGWLSFREAALALPAHFPNTARMATTRMVRGPHCFSKTLFS